MTNEEAKRIIEALLFVSDKPLRIEAIGAILEDVNPVTIRALIGELNVEYSTSNRSFNVKEIAGGFQMMTDPVYCPWINKLYKRPPDRLSGPALETLAIIAYRQPITKSEIEVIRGVNIDGVLHTLDERGLVRSRGRKDTVGRPILYGTTSGFLYYFGLKSLDELPKLREFSESELDFVKEEQKRQVLDVETGKLQEGRSEAESADMSSENER